MDQTTRDRDLDRVKAKIFVGNNAAFLGPLMASLNFVWTKAIETSATDYVNIFWNPDDFDRLTFDERISSLMHELGHNYRLHGLRQGERDPKDWNIACDIRINRDLKLSNYFVDSQWFVGQHPEIKAELEEEIYEILHKPCAPSPSGGGATPGSGSGTDPGPCSCHQLGPITKAQAQTALQNVVQAAQQAKMAGHPGDIPGSVESILDTFLKPKISWRQHINQWFNDKLSTYYSYQRPNRRYQSHGLLMKSRFQNNDRLAHLIYAFDVSGSVSDAQVTVFNSEMKFIKDTYKPKKMTLILFDTKIQKVIEFNENDDFNQLKVVGRGGTSLVEVRKFIMDSDATAAVIFSDLECEPMAPGPKIPIIWVCIDNPRASVPFGKLLHINVDDI